MECPLETYVGRTATVLLCLKGLAPPQAPEVVQVQGGWTCSTLGLVLSACHVLGRATVPLCGSSLAVSEKAHLLKHVGALPCCECDAMRRMQANSSGSESKAQDTTWT